MALMNWSGFRVLWKSCKMRKRSLSATSVMIKPDLSEFFICSLTPSKMSVKRTQVVQEEETLLKRTEVVLWKKF